MPLKSKAWLLSAYRAKSHAAWADWLTATFGKFDWQRLELPGRHFAWRIRGNPLSWLDMLPTEKPDLIIATSMVDLATLKGLHPRLSGVRTVLYFHENQFAYPRGKKQLKTLEPKMVQLYGALAADRVLFNSEYNRTSFLKGVRRLLDRMPDHVPPKVGDRIAAKSDVLPVPIRPIMPAGTRDPRLIVWNHRWEYDKAPDLFADAMIALADRGVDFGLALLGQRHEQIPEALTRLRETLADRIVADDRLPLNEYRALLARAGIVISTSKHEFQGISMLEAASAGCIPLVPDALCYPEIYPAEYRYPADDRDALADRLADWLAGNAPDPANVDAWYEERLEPAWRAKLMDEKTRFHEEMGRSRDA
ncbi:MAG: DUF3524 domain-containing protein [Wenzhouxiangellaceae bacterium]|nr:DUF3524 domain-containing protein [Wenzhouxiangellaceae bacterium]MBS3747652.1 DUF3524 domain-containing protein [Wenzhouxiangellaceae bacterium]